MTLVTLVIYLFIVFLFGATDCKRGQQNFVGLAYPISQVVICYSYRSYRLVQWHSRLRIFLDSLGNLTRQNQ